jgi:polysaccharide export outer membrane protein
MKNLFYCFFTGYIAISLASCTSPKELQYFQGEFDTAALSKFKTPEPIIQKGDMLSITVMSDNPAASAPFNPHVGTVQQPGDQMQTDIGVGTNKPNTATGYQVDKDGNIFFPVIGVIQVEGLTKEQLVQLLDTKLKGTFLTNPYYAIRFLNHKITLLGEVSKPGIYSMQDETPTILDALGMAGDLTFYGKRDNILVIREANGVREFGRIDVTKTDIFKSPYYFLKQGDVVFVDIRKGKIAANDQAILRYVTILTGLATTAALLVSIFQ